MNTLAKFGEHYFSRPSLSVNWVKVISILIIIILNGTFYTQMKKKIV